MGKTCKIHVVDNFDDRTWVEYVNHIPAVNDELRYGGEGRERYYKVIKRVFIFDEPECNYQRVNIGVELIEE